MAHVPRIYSPAATGPGLLALDGEQSRRLTAVLRMRAGDPLLVFSGDGREWAAVVDSVAGGRVHVRLHNLARQQAPALLAVEVWCALIRPARFELLVEKCTEAGADVIRPLTTAFTSRSDAPSPARLERWTRIAVEAAEQSGRLFVPVIAAATPFERALAAGQQAVLLGDPDGAPWPDVLPKLPAAGRLAIAVGPEGGWSAAERAAAVARGALPVRAGATILRTETAAIVLTALVRAAT